jgi:hypothetical protein
MSGSIPTHQHNWFDGSGVRRNTCRDCAMPIDVYLDELTARLQTNQTLLERLDALETRLLALERRVAS